MFSIVNAIRDRAYPDAVAIVQKDQQFTYRELFARCDDIAEAIRTHFADVLAGHVRPRIGVHFPSGIDYVPLAMATLAAGCCFVPMPDELADAEKRDLAARTALDGVLVVSSANTWLPENKQILGSMEIGGKTVEIIRLPHGEPSFPFTDFEALNPAFIRFSSGTTGTSKGVLLSHESLWERINAANEGLRIGPGDRVLWVLPMAHHFAVSIVLYLYFGAVTVIEETHLGEDLLRAGAEQKATVMYGSPVHYRQLVEAPRISETNEWPSLRLAVVTAAALDTPTATRFHARFNKELVQGLGIIELGLPVLNLAGALEAPEAIGLPLPAYQALLRDETGKEPPTGEPGEIHLRGPGMFDAYLDPWKQRTDVLDSDGWFATGDLGRRDDAGRIYICGRKKTLINVGGMKVFPEEVERVLDAHPKIQRSLVEARLHPLYGEVPIARYIPHADGPPSNMELRNHCKQHVSGYKIPLIFTAVQELPLTASGKLKRV